MPGARPIRRLPRDGWPPFLTDRYLVWDLDDLAKSYGQSPYDYAFSDPVRLDFDRAVRILGRWAENRGNETTWGRAEKPPGEGMTRVPKYSTIAEVLGLDGDGAVASAAAPDPDLDARAAALQAALQRGDPDWRRFLDGA